MSLVFYLDYLMGTTKGNQASGSSFFDARTGPVSSQFYSSTIVPNEAHADSGDPSITLGHIPVRPGTIQGSYTHTTGATTVSFTDDGNGTLISSDADLTAGTITYNTGALSITSTANVDANSLSITYEYDTEANTDIPQIDLQLTSAPVVALVRKLRSRWSLEAAQNLNALAA